MPGRAAGYPKITPPREDQAVPACPASGDGAVTRYSEAVRAGHRRGRNGRHVSGPNPVSRPATAARHPQAAGTTSLIGPLLAPVAAPRSTGTLPCELRVYSSAAARACCWRATFLATGCTRHGHEDAIQAARPGGWFGAPVYKSVYTHPAARPGRSSPGPVTCTFSSGGGI